jgi:hypothetical protein
MFMAGIDVGPKEFAAVGVSSSVTALPWLLKKAASVGMHAFLHNAVILSHTTVDLDQLESGRIRASESADLAGGLPR